MTSLENFEFPKCVTLVQYLGTFTKLLFLSVSHVTGDQKKLSDILFYRLFDFFYITVMAVICKNSYLQKKNKKQFKFLFMFFNIQINRLFTRL